jgi:hypothetical protein
MDTKTRFAMIAFVACAVTNAVRLVLCYKSNDTECKADVVTMLVCNIAAIVLLAYWDTLTK